MNTEHRNTYRVSRVKGGRKPSPGCIYFLEIEFHTVVFSHH